ncbi:MAG TPA: rhodanese-like domain-containing protein [Chitinivibrionales bacterium]|nr:rhodanese-like domain-containing protein [Chitinivibrionales bacterium]
MRYFFLIMCIFFVQSAPAYHALSADTLSAWITGGPPFSFILIDVRDTSEVDTVMGNAACRPYHMSLNQGVFAANYSLIPKTSNVILYCRSGGRSAQAATMLDGAGFASVYSMSGGFSLWTGPKQPRANLLPISDLPENSMTANTSVAFSRTAGHLKTETSTGMTCHFTGHRSIIRLVDLKNGSTQIFDTKGKILKFCW